MKIFPHIRLHFLWFCQKQNNFLLRVNDFNFLVLLKQQNLYFLRVFQFNSSFVFVKSITTQFFQCITLHILWFCAKQYKKSVISMYLILILWFCEKNKKLFFLCIRIEYFFWKSKTTELFPRIRHQFLWFKKQYKFCLVYVKDFNFCYLVK